MDEFHENGSQSRVFSTLRKMDDEEDPAKRRRLRREKLQKKKEVNGVIISHEVIFTGIVPNLPVLYNLYTVQFF